MRVALAATGVVVLAVLTACASSSPQAAPQLSDTSGTAATEFATDGGQPTTPDPCGLVTPDEVTAALGKPVDAGQPEPGGLPGQKTCRYGAIDSAELTTISIVAGAATLWDQLRASLQGSGFEEISGLGDAAFRASTQLYVRKGDLILSVLVSGLGDDASLTARLTSLARAALGRV